MSKDSGTGCGILLVAILVIALVLYLAGGFLGNLYNYHHSGNKVAADASFFFFVALAVVVYFIYRLFKSGK